MPLLTVPTSVTEILKVAPPGSSVSTYTEKVHGAMLPPIQVPPKLAALPLITSDVIATLLMKGGAVVMQIAA